MQEGPLKSQSEIQTSKPCYAALQRDHAAAQSELLELFSPALHVDVAVACK